MSQDFIPDSQFTPDSEAQAPEVKQANPDFIPDSQFQSDEDKFTSPGEKYLAGYESVLKGATAGLSQIAEQHPEFIPGPLGTAARLLKMSGETSPENVAAREEQNSGIATAGKLVGGLGLGGSTGGGLVGLLPDAAGAGARIAALATEGAGYNAVQGAATRETFGEPALNAQKIAADAGMGALLGAGTGVLFESLAPLAKAMLKAKAVETGIPDSSVGATPEQGAEGPIAQNSQPIVDAPIEKTGPQSSSFDDIRNKVDSAVKKGVSLELPQKEVLLDASSRVPLENPINPLQVSSLENQGARDAYKATLDTPGEKPQLLRDYETLQRNELNDKTDQTIASLSPEMEPTGDAAKGGERAIKAFTDQHQAEKKALGEVFNKLKETPLPEGMDAQAGMLEKMTKAVPGVAHMFEAGGEGLEVLPYKTSWGIDRATYNAVKEAMDSLAENPADFETLQNIRKGLSQHVDVTAQGDAASEIRSLKAAMMDYMQEAVEHATPDVEVRDAFRRYAINEQERAVIEKNFGASVGTPEFGAISKIKPEYIGDRIFANTATVKAAKNILDPKKFGEILANWITEAKTAATTDNVFSSNKFGRWLTKNQDALKIAFEDNPGALQRLKDLNTIARILPDSKPINPSGTAKTLANLLKNAWGENAAEHVWSKGATLLPHAYREVVALFEHNKAMSNLDAQLKGAAAQNTVRMKIAKTAAKVSEDIGEGASSIFRGGAAASVAAVGAAGYEENKKRVEELSRDPEAMTNHMTAKTAAIFEAAPDVAQGLHTAMVSGIQFLNSKIPRPQMDLPLAHEWKPSNSQMQKFNRYYSTVNSPLGVLKRVKNGSLSNEDMEALQTVHPDLLNEMRMSVAGEMQKEKGTALPSGTKIALSKFLGQPLTQSMLPQTIQANQASFIAAPPQHATVKGMKNLSLAKRSSGDTDQD